MESKPDKFHHETFGQYIGRNVIRQPVADRGFGVFAEKERVDGEFAFDESPDNEPPFRDEPL